MIDLDPFSCTATHITCPLALDCERSNGGLKVVGRVADFSRDLETNGGLVSCQRFVPINKETHE